MTHKETSDSWTLEDGYTTDDASTYPRRALFSGTQGGFNIVLKLNTNDLDYICRGAQVQGFKVSLHMPSDTPSLSKQHFNVPLGKEVVMRIKPKMMETSKGLAGYSTEKRQCFFSKERKLKFFKVYTKSNCELECLSNFTYSEISRLSEFPTYLQYVLNLI